MDPQGVIEQVVQDVGAVYAACERLDRPGVAGRLGEEVVPVASMYKVLLALEVADRFVSGRLSRGTPCRIEVGAHSPGGMGLTEFVHPATVSLEDLLYMSLAWSDNTASDMLLGYVGLDALHARARDLGLDSMHVVADCRTLLRLAGEDLGYPSEQAAIEAKWAPTNDTDDLAVERTTRSSVSELVRLAQLIALERAAQPMACRLVRRLMERQIWTPRFAGGLPQPGWTLASKTGTLSPWRGEFGIASRCDGPRFAIAVVIRQHHTQTPSEVVDRAVGAVARNLTALASTRS